MVGAHLVRHGINPDEISLRVTMPYIKRFKDMMAADNPLGGIDG